MSTERDLGTDSEFLFSATALQLRNLERRCSGPEISIFLSIAVGSVQHENDLRVRTSRLRVVHPDFDFRVSCIIEGFSTNVLFPNGIFAKADSFGDNSGNWTSVGHWTCTEYIEQFA
jgi:hypothetical protein